MTCEADLYPALKAFLEAQGFEVKAEIGAADVVAMRGEEPPVIVEMKTGFSLTLFHQAIVRQSVTDRVYLAVPRGRGRPFQKSLKANTGLARRLGLGLLVIAGEHVELHAEPAPFTPRKSAKRQASLIREFARRDGDPNRGGQTRARLVTSYRQGCLKIAQALVECGEATGAEMARRTGIAASRAMMADNHYGWFCRLRRGVYGLTEAGRAAVTDAADHSPGSNSPS